MTSQSLIKSLVPTKRSIFVLSLTVVTWFVAIALSTWFCLSPSDLPGSEWIGSPLVGLALLAVCMTAYYRGTANKSIRPTVHVIAWTCLLFLVTTITMLTNAQFIFGGWRKFLTWPIMGTFDLILIALGTHFTLKEKSRGVLFFFLIWALVLFYLVTATISTLAYNSQNPNLWQFGFVAVLGFALSAGLMTVAYFGFRSRLITWLAALSCWAGCVVIGTGVPMLVASIYLFPQQYTWPLHYMVGTLCVTLLVTALMLAVWVVDKRASVQR